MDNEQKWSLTGFLDELKRIHETMPDRRFVFILGAGASIESNVKGAASLAKEWMKIIFRRSNNGGEYDNWLQSNPLQIDGWDANNLAAHYPQIFSFCFNGDHESGYAELEKAIDQGSPSFGYAVLAWVLAQDRHNMVVTTNFDNLVADSMYIYGGKTPLVIGHESLASYLKPMSRRPMIAKIHRDLFTDPINDEHGVGELKSDWVDALKNIFSFYTPVFIGYGGNDGSLMNFLKNLETNDISGRPFWCYYEKGDKPNGDIKELMLKHKGILVPTPGFDQLMFKIGSTWGYERQQQHHSVSEHTKRMLDTLDENIQKVYQESPKEVREKLREPSSDEKKSWLDWILEAKGKETYIEQEEVYRKAVIAEPKSTQIMNSFAIILHQLEKHKEAEQYYKKALGIDPNSPIYLGNYALFLHELDRNDEAEQLFEQTLEIAPDNASILGNYAQFLEGIDRGNEAELLFKKALDIAPENPDVLAKYAVLLYKLERYEESEKSGKAAIELDPGNSDYIGNYANILEKLDRDEEAEQYYKKALEDSPYSIVHLGNYADLLDKLDRDEEAEQYYKKAINIDPNSTHQLGNYADFLLKLGRNAEASEYLKKCLTIEPNDDFFQQQYEQLLKVSNTTS
ncbi:hypothetical protein A3712_04545 [Vibrio sp. HI00D65]|uniref:tetratricopeptide repeat protein n=1 Tax=Vibrio sp. HI00D65 TaxID=1822216 RepID=UPI0007B8D898|nr:tetratricopeptide repeat protein [Vibrio sp. HI00D65]KZX57500.1 hypothetical protein A3712_04545 [Vibrio sp. HI00D65]